MEANNPGRCDGRDNLLLHEEFSTAQRSTTLHRGGPKSHVRVNARHVLPVVELDDTEPHLTVSRESLSVSVCSTTQANIDSKLTTVCPSRPTVPASAVLVLWNHSSPLSLWVVRYVVDVEVFGDVRCHLVDPVCISEDDRHLDHALEWRSLVGSGERPELYRLPWAQRALEDCHSEECFMLSTSNVNDGVCRRSASLSRSTVHRHDAQAKALKVYGCRTACDYVRYPQHTIEPLDHHGRPIPSERGVLSVASVVLVLPVSRHSVGEDVNLDRLFVAGKPDRATQTRKVNTHHAADVPGWNLFIHLLRGKLAEDLPGTGGGLNLVEAAHSYSRICVVPVMVTRRAVPLMACKASGKVKLVRRNLRGT